ncbi:putative mediator of RNA polymerase II transcription subunit 11-like [Apostichopus japonicus]|uniref:Mediator of RNA polymerase II transcription subunit 11 n=1 Tax=Stichopus japonicus TaxID=307972 RepID=A0A2G8L759_STIJA|nr:putative mediator of RNA polymerase II transcription subunit 11-like [Apostichopus japonicus]
MSSSLKERLKELETIEGDIAQVVHQAGRALTELAKEKPNDRNMNSSVKSFIKTLESVENNLMKQINYLSQVASGQPHEGSSYSAQKDAQMAIHRLENAKVKLLELKTICDP